MAIITTAHVTYQITRVLILPAGAQNGKPGAVRVCATELNADYPANLAWRADVYFDRNANDSWRFSSWNIGVTLDAAQPVAQAVEAGLADYINEIDLDQRDAEVKNVAVDVSDFEAADDSTPAVHPYRAETIARALAQNVKINDAMVAASHTLRDVAADFVTTYRGMNSFVQNVAIHQTDRGFLSVPQMRGALNVMLAEARQQRAEDKADALYFDARHNDGAPSSAIQQYYIDLRSTSERTVDDAGAPPAAEEAPQDDRRLPNGTYTIILDQATDEYRTIRLADAPDHFNAAPGTQIASYLAGGDNEGDYNGFAFVVGTTIKLWQKFAASARAEKLPILNALDTLITSADPISHMREYVLRSARCGVCGRKLTTPDSIRLGIGPVCAGKLEAQGYKFEMPKAARAILAAVKTIEEAAPAATQPKTKEERLEAARRAQDAVNELFD